MALTDKLTAIADAIRGKTGGTDALTLEAMAKAITALETGGGGRPYASGSYVPSSNITVAKSSSTYVQIPINVDFRPRMFFFWEDTAAATSSTSERAVSFNMGFITSPTISTQNKGMTISVVYSTDINSYTVVAYSSIGKVGGGTTYLSSSNFNEDWFSLTQNKYDAYLLAGRQYSWLVIGDEE